MECFGHSIWKGFNDINDRWNWSIIAEIDAHVKQAERGVHRLLHDEHFWKECAA